jgi:hypothetical protein
LAADPRARSLGVDLTVTEAQLAQRESRHADACRLLRQALGRCRDFHKRHFELFLLAKSLDALGQYDEAFETLEEAHRSQVAHFKLIAPLITVRGAPALVITQHSCDAADVAAWGESAAPAAEDSPIFVVGFPRSGTTLLELTLDAHPALRSMDEQPFLQNAIDELMSQGVRYPAGLARAGDTHLAAARSKYWDRVHRKLQLGPGQRLVDKNPLNLLRLPAIRRLFPKAHILLAVRHPFDVLLSCYMQHFTAPDFALLCVNLPTLARAYRRSFDFWFEQAALLRPAVHEVTYESLVADFDVQVRKIAEFLELPWNEAMLEPGRHAEAKGYISTPSYAQVVQPVNSKAVGRWRPYGAHFTALSPQLQPYFERWGYSAEAPG